MTTTNFSHALPDTLTREQIKTSVIVMVSEQSGLPVTLTTDLRTIKLDSLDYVSLASWMESEFNLPPISDADLFRFQVVSQLVDYVIAAKEELAKAAESRVRQEAEQTA